MAKENETDPHHPNSNTPLVQDITNGWTSGRVIQEVFLFSWSCFPVKREFNKLSFMTCDCDHFDNFCDLGKWNFDTHIFSNSHAKKKNHTTLFKEAKIATFTDLLIFPFMFFLYNSSMFLDKEKIQRFIFFYNFLQPLNLKIWAGTYVRIITNQKALLN